MSNKLLSKNPIQLLKLALSTLVQNPAIFFPFLTIAFVQIFVLEILYFTPRYPLNVFFGPIITTLADQRFLHYPLNLFYLPKMYQFALSFIHIFISSYFVVTAVLIIEQINSGKKANVSKAMSRAMSKYVHIVITAALSLGLLLALFYLYGLAFNRAQLIRSDSGPFNILKKMVLYGSPYIKLLMNVFVASLFAYVYQFIALDNQKVFSAIGRNIKMFFGAFFMTLVVVLIPNMINALVIILRSSVTLAQSFPEFSVLAIVGGVLLMVFIDAWIFTSLTIYFLLKKEAK